MSIEINGIPSVHSKEAVDGSQSRPGRERPEVAEHGQARRKPTDSVSLTDTPARMRELESALSGLPPVDSQRVQEIRKALADGSYRPDPQRVADKLLSIENLLSGNV